MSNNKQSSVEWYIIERHIIEIQSRLGLILPIEYDAKLIKIEEQAKAMHKEEIKHAHYQGQSDEKEYWNIGDKCMTRFQGKCMEYYNETFGE